MTQPKRTAVHIVRFSLSAKLLIGGAIVALALNALVPLFTAETTQAGSMPTTIAMTCKWIQAPAGEHMIPVEATCTGSSW